MTLVEHDADLHPICPVDQLVPDRGVAALLLGRSIAVFLLATGEVAAIDNTDPISGANVLSRGIVGDVHGAPTVASPIYKQRFDLRTGECLDADGVRVAVHDARVVDGTIRVALRS